MDRFNGLQRLPQPRFDAMGQILDAGFGHVVEAALVWGDRVLKTTHFSEAGVFTVGAGANNHIVIPKGLCGVIQYPLMSLGPKGAHIFVTGHAAGEYLHDDGRVVSFDEILSRHASLRPDAICYIDLKPGEAVRINFDHELSLVLKVGSAAPYIPSEDPVVDREAKRGTIIASALVFLFYMQSVFVAKSPEEKKEVDELKRVAIVKFMQDERMVKVDDEAKKKFVAAPKPVPEPAKAAGPKADDKPIAKPEIEPEPKKVVKKVQPAPHAPAPKKIVKEAAPARKIAPPKPAKKIAKKVSAKAKTPVVAAVRPTAKPKATPKPEAPPDENKMGILGAFAKSSVSDKMHEAQDSGEILELANHASGNASHNEGASSLSPGLREGRGGGTGVSTVGVRVNTRGRGGGGLSAGHGAGLGMKASAQVNLSEELEELSGTMDREAIRRVIMAERRTIKYCYEKDLAHSPDLHGRLVLEWQIGDGGKVVGAHVKTSSLGGGQTAQCILGRLRTWHFPDPPNNTVAVVAFPFVFTAR